MASKNAVVLGSAGYLGWAFSNDLVASGWKVTQVDKNPEEDSEIDGATSLKGDIAHPNKALQAALKSADVVIVAVPEAAMETAIASAAEHAGKGALIVDTAIFKYPMPKILASLGDDAHDHNFMGIAVTQFTEKSLQGTTIFAINYSGFADSKSTNAFIKWMKSVGVEVKQVSIHAHSDIVTARLSLTHAAVITFGNSLPKRGFEATGAMAAFVAHSSVVSPQLYWRLQRDNPKAQSARTLIRLGLERLDNIVLTGSEADMKQFVNTIRTEFTGIPVNLRIPPPNARAQAILLAFGYALTQLEIDVPDVWNSSESFFQMIIQSASIEANRAPMLIVDLQRTPDAAADREQLLAGLDELDFTVMNDRRRRFYADLAYGYRSLGDQVDALIEAWAPHLARNSLAKRPS